MIHSHQEFHHYHHKVQIAQCLLSVAGLPFVMTKLIVLSAIEKLLGMTH